MDSTNFVKILIYLLVPGALIAGAILGYLRARRENGPIGRTKLDPIKLEMIPWPSTRLNNKNVVDSLDSHNKDIV